MALWDGPGATIVRPVRSADDCVGGVGWRGEGTVPTPALIKPGAGRSSNTAKAGSETIDARKKSDRDQILSNADVISPRA
jgi:hypothetical protein